MSERPLLFAITRKTDQLIVLNLYSDWLLVVFFCSVNWPGSSRQNIILLAFKKPASNDKPSDILCSWHFWKQNLTLYCNLLHFCTYFKNTGTTLSGLLWLFKFSKESNLLACHTILHCLVFLAAGPDNWYCSALCTFCKSCQ